MQVTVTGRHISMTEAVKDYSCQKLQRIVNKHLPDIITKAHIIMDIQKYRYTVELELHGPGTNIYGKATSGDIYTSVDKVMDKVERQLMKYKSRYNKLRHAGSPSIKTQI